MLIVLAISILTSFIPFLTIHAGSLISDTPVSFSMLRSHFGLNLQGFSELNIHLNGVQLAFLGGTTFSSLGNFMSLVPFRALILTALFCIVLLAPGILDIISLFLTIFCNGKKSSCSVIVLQFVSFIFHIIIMIAILRILSAVNNYSFLSGGSGIAFSSIANLAAFALAILRFLKPDMSVPDKAIHTEKNGVLVCLTGEYAGGIIPLHEGEEVIIGRDGAVCNIVLDGNAISRKHCAVRFNVDTGHYTVTDLSLNGTYVKGGNRLMSGQPTELSNWTILVLGSEDNLLLLQ